MKTLNPRSPQSDRLASALEARSRGRRKVTSIEEPPLILTGEFDPEDQRDGIDGALVIGDVESVRSLVQKDVAGGAPRAVDAIEIDEALVVDPENSTVIGDHAKFVIAGVTNPEGGMVVDAEKIGAGVTPGIPSVSVNTWLGTSSTEA